MRQQLALLLFGLLMPYCWMASTALACEPCPDTWYLETITLEATALPTAFVLSAPTESKERQQAVWIFTTPSAARHGAIYIANQTAIPVYVMSLIHRERLMVETPDAVLAARLRMAHEVAAYMASSQSVLSLGIQELIDLDPALEDRNVLSLNPPAPNGNAPGAQQSTLLLVYGEQVVLLPFTISYQLNQAFDTGCLNADPIPSQAMSQSRDTAMQTGSLSQSFWLGLALLLILLFASWRLWDSKGNLYPPGRK